MAQPEGTSQYRVQLLWACPKCGRQFAHENQWHSCHNYSLDSYLEGKDSTQVRLFKDLLNRVTELGEMRVEHARTGVVFAGRTHFAGLQTKGSGVEVTFILDHEVRHPRIGKTERITPNRIAHKATLEEAGQVDGSVLKWLHEAHTLGTKIKIRPGLRE